MAQLTKEKMLSWEINVKELHEKIKKKFWKLPRKKDHPYETGVKTFWHHFSLIILFWLEEICDFAHYWNVNKDLSVLLDQAI